MVLDCLFGRHLRLYLLTFLKGLCIICVNIHDKKHLKEEGVYFASQLEEYVDAVCFAISAGY